MTTSINPNGPSRRGFLRFSLRWSGVASLGALAAWLAHRRQIVLACTPGALCRGCPKMAACPRPAADTERQSTPNHQP